MEIIISTIIAKKTLENKKKGVYRIGACSQCLQTMAIYCICI